MCCAPQNCTIISERDLLAHFQETTFTVPQISHTVDQIVANMRTADMELRKSEKVPKLCKLLANRCLPDWRATYISPA